MFLVAAADFPPYYRRTKWKCVLQRFFGECHVSENPNETTDRTVISPILDGNSAYSDRKI